MKANTDSRKNNILYAYNSHTIQLQVIAFKIKKTGDLNQNMNNRSISFKVLFESHIIYK